MKNHFKKVAGMMVAVARWLFVVKCTIRKATLSIVLLTLMIPALTTLPSCPVQQNQPPPPPPPPPPPLVPPVHGAFRTKNEATALAFVRPAFAMPLAVWKRLDG